MEQLRKMGYHTVAMALKEDSLRPDDEKLHNVEKLAIILGTEGEGLAADKGAHRLLLAAVSDGTRTALL